MAKKKIDPTEYIKGLPGLDEATRQLLADKIGGSPEALKRFQEDLMTVPEFQSRMSELERDRQAAEASKREADELKVKNEQWYRENVGSGMLDQIRQEKAQSDALLAAYQQTYGILPGATTAAAPASANPGYVTKQDFEAALERVQTSTRDWSAGLLAKGNKLAFDHFKQFGEPLDLEALMQEAIKINKEPASPLSLAYERMTAEKRQAANEAAQKARDEQNRKDWEKDWRSRQGNPMEADPTKDHSIIYQALRQPASDKPMTDHNTGLEESKRMESFIKTWRSAGEELEAKENAKVA